MIIGLFDDIIIKSFVYYKKLKNIIDYKLIY